MSLYEELKKSPHPSADFSHIVNRRTIDKKQLFSCSFELTPICNFTCPFCYARKSGQELEDAGERLISFDGWRGLIDELCEMGAVSLTLTGGECTLHPDFCRIYEYAYDRGMTVNVMTNASALTDTIFTLFTKKAPYMIYATVYGASRETYARTCGNANHYDTVMRNIHRLCEKKMPLLLQFTSSKENVGDLYAVYKLSKSLDVPFRHTSLLSGFGRCTTETADEETGDTDMYLEQAKTIWLDERGLTEEAYRSRPVISQTFDFSQPVVKKGMPCNAGRNSCYINYRGEVQPCVSFEDFRFSRKGKSLAEVWRELVAWADDVPRLTGCARCVHVTHCKQCLALHYNDTKEFGKPSPRLCYKILHPEKAKEREERYARDGYLRSDLDYD